MKYYQEKCLTDNPVNMKNKRHEKILEVIEKKNIETQEELAKILNEAGFVVTQATVSRDIKKLGLVKVKGKGSHQKYAPKAASTLVEYDKYVRVLKDAITGMDDAENILVIKTVPGMAMAVAAALDSLRIPEIIGSIAGDDTIMCAVRSVNDTLSIMKKIKKIVEQ